MSFTETEVVGDDLATDDLGHQEVEGGDEGSPDESQEVEPERLDVDAYGNHLVAVTVDGEEFMVPLAEVRGGYQRQQDYTRKTQEVAAQRQEAQRALAIAAAIDQDPYGTLSVLAQEYGIDFAAAAAEADPELSPLEQRIKALEADKHQSAITSEVAHLASKWGDKFDPTEALSYAVTKKITLTAAAAELAADKFLAEQARGAVQAQRQAEDDSRTAAKRGAQVAGGHTAKGGNGPIDTNGLSTREILRLVQDGKLK